MGATSVELGPFTDGVNLVDPLTKLTPNELSQCINWRTGVRGDFYKRPGHGNYGSTPAQVNGAAFVNLALRYYKSDGSKKLIAAAGGKLKFGNDITGAWTPIDIDGSIGNNMSATNLADWMVYKDRLYITDGVRPQRYNGTDDIYAGHPVATAPTLAQSTNAPVGSGLTLLGTYKYFVTFVAGNMGEGTKGAEASITLTGTNNRVSLSAIATAVTKHEVSARRIYRTKANGTLFYFLAEVAGNVTTTYVDDIPDSALDEEFITTILPPTTARFVILGHDERTYWFGMSGVDASLVYVSDVGFPDRIAATSFFSVANNDGDILTGAGLVPGGIVFFKKNSCWLLRAFGFGLINIQPKEKKGSGVGTTSPFSIVTTPIGLIFKSQQNKIYRFDGTNIDEIGRKVSSEFFGLTQAANEKMVACYHDFRYILSYDYRGVNGYNKRTLEFDTIALKWDGPHENLDFYTPSYYSVWDSVLDKGELYWGEAKAATGSFVYGRTEFTKYDRGNKFPSTGRTGANAFAKLADVLSIKAFVHGEFSSDARIIFTHIDEGNERISVELNIPIVANAAVYNVSKYNDGTKYAGRKAQVLEGSLGNCRSKVPIYEISDGNASVAKMTLFQLLAEGLPLK